MAAQDRISLKEESSLLVKKSSIVSTEDTYSDFNYWKMPILPLDD
jgi:hypothetical protein